MWRTGLLWFLELMRSDEIIQVENAMNGTARLHQYCDSLESEAPLQLPNAPSPWPLKGSVNFENVQLRYRAGLPLALKNLNLSINGGEVMGIVGRTGAGKSSITSALFRLSELSGGRIMIDDVDIAKVLPPPFPRLLRYKNRETDQMHLELLARTTHLAQEPVNHSPRPRTFRGHCSLKPRPL